MDKKYQVFISSTYEDLREERDKVRDAILSMYHFPVGMELFGAASAEQWEIIKETIDTSDYYVLIVGQRYGTIIPEGPDKGISYTEKEFRYAKEKGIPILAFLIDESVPVKPEYVEKKHTWEFDIFKVAVKNGRTVTWWNNADELAQKVTAALHKEIKRHPPQQCWVRVDDSLMDHNDNTSYASQITKLVYEKQKLSDDLEMLKKAYTEKVMILEMFDKDKEKEIKEIIDNYNRIIDRLKPHVKILKEEDDKKAQE
ncbi:DUF4062 domain-containing protein [Clostridiales bacterium FE2010]|nr:DUF4062 domain-containing protein [Clostridiales bacterium FE2010]